jgi:hypothetical protein
MADNVIDFDSNLCGCIFNCPSIRILSSSHGSNTACLVFSIKLPIQLAPLMKYQLEPAIPMIQYPREQAPPMRYHEQTAEIQLFFWDV